MTEMAQETELPIEGYSSMRSRALEERIRHHAHVEEWTPPILAEVMGVSESRVRELIFLGRIPDAYLVSNRWLFPAEPEILRPEKAGGLPVPGPTTDYMDWWESKYRHADARYSPPGDSRG